MSESDDELFSFDPHDYYNKYFKKETLQRTKQELEAEKIEKKNEKEERLRRYLYEEQVMEKRREEERKIKAHETKLLAEKELEH